MVTSPYGAVRPSLVPAACAPRKATGDASAARRTLRPLRTPVRSSRSQSSRARGGSASCIRLMHMWTTEQRSPDGRVTSMLQLYLVEHCESHGESRHVVQLDASGWRCTGGEQCHAVAVAQAEHERAGRARGESR